MSSLFTEETLAYSEDIQGSNSVGDELFATQSSDVGTRSRITSRRVTNSNRVITAAGSEVTLVHTLRVTTTRSWSSPRINSFSVNQDGHAVLGLDLVNAIPTSSDLFGWINNLDAFIKDNNVGLEETQVRTENGQSANNARNNQFADATIESALRDESSKESNQHPTHNQSAGGTELFGIIHAHSLSQLDLNLDIKQAEAHI